MDNVANIFVITSIWVAIFAEARKPYTLNVLNLVPSNGQQMQGVELLVEISKLTAEIVNNNTDFLPDYHIEMLFEDESEAAAKVINFSRTYNDETRRGIYQSPIITGPEYSANCRSVAPTAPHLNIVLISTFCTAPFLSEHSRFRNMYLPMSTGQMDAFATIHFLKDVGKWQKFAIITNADIANDYTTAIYLQKEAVKNGLTVTLFSMLVEVDESIMQRLKESDIRIFVFYTGIDRLQFKFLCMAHELGMTGPRYIFVSNLEAFIDPSALSETPSGCGNISVLTEQLQQTYWIGPAMQIEDESMKTAFGYGQSKFDQMLDIFTGQPQESSGEYPFRFLYHDNFLKTFYALHETELSLRKQNLTLRDAFAGSSAEAVMKVANNSVFHLNRMGLRIGPMRYSERGNVEGDVHVIAHYTPDKGIQNYITVHQKVTGSELDYRSYYGHFVREIRWATEDGLPPRDEARYIRRVRSASEEGFTLVTVIAAVLLAIHCGCAALIWRQKSRGFFDYDIPLTKMAGIFGCILLDIGASLFTRSSQIPWSLGVVFIIFGLSIIVSILTCRIAVITIEEEIHRKRLKRPSPTERQSIFYVHQAANKIGAFDKSSNRNCDILMNLPSPTVIKNSGSFQLQACRPVSSIGKKVSFMHVISPRTLPKGVWLRYEQFILLSAAIFSVLAVVVFIFWLVIDTPVCSLQTLQPPVYESGSDKLTETATQVCTSNYMTAWGLSFTFADILVLVAGVYYTYQMKKRGRHNLTSFQFNYMKFGVANALTMIVATLVIVVILSDAVGQQITIAASAMLIAGLTSLTWMLPHSKKQN